jgi:hypothetical protein
MPLLSCSVNRDEIKLGVKIHTIRFRETPPIVGENLFLWWKARTVDRDFIGTTVCIGVEPIVIDGDSKSVVLNHKKLSKPSIAKLSKNDGFRSVKEFWSFFEKSKPSKNGWLIKWNPDFITQKALRPEVFKQGNIQDEAIDNLRLYHPSTGSEHSSFNEHWCDDCHRQKSCFIMLKAMSDIRSNHHWILIGNKPVCTEFIPENRSKNVFSIAREYQSLESKGQLNLLTHHAEEITL